MTEQVLDLFESRPETLTAVQAAEDEKNRCVVHVGDARRILSQMPDGYFNCVVTSPPYWGLRDYGVEGQIGAEPTIDEYIADLVHLFREVKRTLADDGTFWLNIGDSYTSGGRTWRDTDAKNKGRAMSYRAPTPEGLKPKDLIGVPWKLAFALQADGWYLRTDIIWNKPNCQPESVKDRPTRSHEYVFLFSKSEKYYYDWEVIKEPAVDPKQKSKNRRTVWNITTEPYPGSHFAVYPRALVRLCVSAGSPKNGRVLDPFFGSGTTGVVCNELGRECVGIELSAEYAKLARDRLLKRR
ncbi:site-specific DNA-methyltransferase (cytosine-N4-specific) [Azotobacter beijerinckii]|uniref:Methyltransferase n=1 Tax=Azotobacter beijerinckii TaxID=170623 RepID=A0A1H9QQR0_9GAMM|nr:site-specific DNA-methyltransferase [Azotobacter beijerinckii]SER62083.1 site-specific DNA-methyltransferase (cytosine-N4-specific) [Azotobacter beijerinckii]